MSSIKHYVSFGLASFLFLAASSARADGLLVAPSKLAPAARTSLGKDIAGAKRDLAGVRAKVRDVQSVKPEVYKKRRNPIPEASLELKSLGKDALVPMLEALAFDASQPGLDAREREALVVGMLSAVGDIRDARSTPVLSAILDGETSATPAALAASIALGKACGPNEIKVLKAKSAEGSSVRAAAVQGLGECRTRESANALVSASKSASDTATQRAAVRGLGTLGSSWAWAAMGKADDQEAIDVRTLASDRLIEVFVKTAELRTDASRAILKCDAPNALERVRSAKKGADAETVKALEGVERLLKKQATRR